METSNKLKWAFIVNPVAGNGHSLIVEQELNKQLKERNIDTKTVKTQRTGHAKQLAKELAEQGFNPIVAVGGDGTLNEMASALINYPQCAIGLIPAGTGNDFAQIPGLSTHFEQKDWDMFFEANTHSIDVGRCNGNFFLTEWD